MLFAFCNHQYRWKTKDSFPSTTLKNPLKGRQLHNLKLSKRTSVNQLIRSELFEIRPEDAAVKTVDLYKRFKVEKSRDSKQPTFVEPIKNVSFVAQQGEIFGLLGPNASGKTTLLRCLATLITPDSGTFEIFGVDGMKKPDFIRHLFGYVGQEEGFDKVLTGREHLKLFADLHHLSRKETDESIEALVDLLNLQEFVDRLTGSYSGGIKRRLDLAIALLARPPLLILDEPTVGLDVESRTIIWNVLKGYRDNGGSIVLTSHYLEEVDILADRVLILEKGQVIAQGRPRDLKESLGGDRVTIRIKEFTTIEESKAALEILSRTEWVYGGNINLSMGNAIELVVSSGEVASNAIQKLLREKGFQIFSYTQSKPSLGDVYLAATGRTLLDADIVGRDSRDPKRTKKERMTI
eukprot:jgi/Galph1/3629/GphlegSOOS_G2278.1